MRNPLLPYSHLQHHHHQSTTATTNTISHLHSLREMLVPRRKGQLLKLLILVPLSLLLATSIYYQFYYNDEYQGPNSHSSRRPAAVSSQVRWSQNRRAVINSQSNSEELDLSSSFGSSIINNEASNVDDLEDINEHSSSSSSSRQAQANDSRRLRQQEKYAADRGLQQNYNNLPISRELETGSSIMMNSERDSDNSIVVDNDNEDVDTDEEKSSSSSRRRELGSSSSAIVAVSSSSSSSISEDKLPLPAPDSFATGDSSQPGELGRPVVLKNLTKRQQDLVKVGWDNNAFNQYISDIISVNRSLPDVRDPSCRNLKYPNVDELPQTSVIICFHNEAWSVLLRTVHSIINRSPKELVKEIILVDDFSSHENLGKQLEDYVRPLKIVKVVRAERREGLIRARLLGAKAATAPVLTFLDSHCECADGWLEPLLKRIYEDSTAVVCPVIDVISDKTFEYHYRGDASAVSVGGFDWNLQFNWHAIPEREKKRRKHKYDPLRSPTMAGGLFSIDKEFFERLGTYDSGFDIWGGENLELSFKTWMCGGTLEILPCSHVGHVFRSRSPYKWRTGVNVLKRNSVRLAEVWMDDYKKYYYDRIGHELGEYGDISERVQLRKQLNCKPFSYYVHEIYPELFIPGEAIAYGEVRNESPGKIKMCLDSTARKSDYQKPLGLYPCHGSGGNQYWLLSRDGEIRRDEACVDYAGHDVVLFPCHGSGGNQMWIYERDTMLVRHSTSGQCMELARDKIRLKMSDCDPNKDAQKWAFQHYNATLAATHL